ncbi:MAG: DUF2975 domain-containing protein [Clostridia bacterium]|nr:DUF2975 domain-containing protein [Clostridia bacterium]
MKRHASAMVSLIICIICAAALLVLLFTMPDFFRWFYLMMHGQAGYAGSVVRTVVVAFYCCAPFAAAALAMMIVILRNVLRDQLFIRQNVTCFRWISWCCYAVMVITGVGTAYYFSLLVVAFTMGVVGTLLRVVKNMVQAAVELQEENDLTI